LSNSKKVSLKKYKTQDIFNATNYVQSLVNLYGSAKLKLPRKKRLNSLIIGSEAEKLSKILSKKYSDSISFIGLHNLDSAGAKQKKTIISALKKIKKPLDIIFICNALELIEDDINYLLEVSTKIHSGGVLIIMAPAHQALYSSIDKLSNRHRRYGLLEMKKIVTNSGFRVAKSYYQDPLGALSYMIYKLIDNDKGQLSANLMSYYDKYIFRMSTRLQFFTKKLFGKNVVLVSVKK